MIYQIRPNFRALAIVAWDHRCAYCHEPFTDERPAELDHFQPLAHEGAHAEHNLVSACRRCNNVKAAQDPFVFLHDRQRRRRRWETYQKTSLRIFGPGLP